MNFRQKQLFLFSILFLGYATYAYSRKSVSLTLPVLLSSGILDKTGAGAIASAQNLAYAISKFIGGVLSDKLSPRLLFSAGLLLSGLSCLLFSFSSALPMFVLLWFMNGFAQGAGWPSCAKLLKKWFSPSQFGTFWSTLSASSNLSGALSPMLTAFIISYTDWRSSIAFSGVCSLIMSIVGFCTINDQPPINEISLEEKVKNVTEKETSKESTKYTSKDLLKSPFLWLIAGSYMSVFAAKTAAVDWSQLYLMEDRQFSQLRASSFVSSLESGGFFGGILAGYLTDILMKKYEGRMQGSPRILAAIIFMGGVAASLYAFVNFVTLDSSQVFVTVLGMVLGGCLYGPIAIYGILAAESYPAAVSGTAHAYVALSANIGAMLAGLPFSYVAQLYGWSASFVFIFLMVSFTVVIMVLLKDLKPKVEKQE
ncbi:glucose-6-phosphate exchanger SLC37A4-like [Artemia franciscana]|uniref:Major facilitator superfamily (MFS) profile domain-containing protein n=1 Tax=Artemia franciscana TaxID=6661 RepID=A0AA88IK43_ARTSF|nr:hypothetical protein QYM36_002719 [Artemia franciscana]